MINGGRVLGLIPARGSSKRVPRKNLRLLGGKPLLQWTAEAVLGSRFVDRSILSTDDEEIARVGLGLGLEAPFRRPADEASDSASAADVVRHAIRTLDDQFEFVVYLQPTSPFRLTADIDACLELLAGSDADCCVTVRRATEHPEWMYFVTPDERLQPVTAHFDTRRGQDLRDCFLLNGAVYAARVDSFLRSGTFLTERTMAHVMPPARSIDLDEPADFDAAEALLQRNPI